ncbi:MAG: hypothetical protein ACREVG_13415 [Burkholderiales bacterium]
MTIARTLIVFAVGSLCVPASAQEIGRLFHSTEQRNALDSLRKTKPQQQKPPGPEQTASAQPARIDGYVLRSDGKSMLWVNGQFKVGQ